MNAEQNVKRTERQDLYFEAMADMDLTKHMGSLDATRRIAELCHIGPESTVLDVGCGVGYTPLWMAGQFGCRVVGLDLYESMVERARERVRRAGLEEKVEIRQGDMMALPFDDGQFDAVIAESVVAFAPDKAQALAEFARVLVPGGHVGFTEATWNREPTDEMLARLPSIFGENYETFQVDGWRALVEDAGFEDVVAEAHPIRIKREAQGRMERIGCRNMLGVLPRFLVMILKKPQIRSLYGGALNEPKELVTSWDYGIYAGRKPK